MNSLHPREGRYKGASFLCVAAERQALRVVRTNIDGTIYLIHRIGGQMRSRHEGRILITGSIAELMPGTYQAVYNGTRAFLDSFSVALNSELAGSGVTVTCLMPGAPETEFFERAGMMDTRIGTRKKADAADVAKAGFDAMMKGEVKVVDARLRRVSCACDAPQTALRPSAAAGP